MKSARRNPLDDTAIIGILDFYSESIRSVYELKFTRRKSKLYEQHRLRACVYKWHSEAEHVHFTAHLKVLENIR